MLDEAITHNIDDVVIPDKDVYILAMCANEDVFRFCDYYGVNIWTFVDLTTY